MKSCKHIKPKGCGNKSSIVISLHIQNIARAPQISSIFTVDDAFDVIENMASD